MAAHIRGVDVRDGDIETRAWSANFFGGGDDRLRAAENFPHGVAARNVPERAVFEFASRADDRTLAIAFHDFGIAAQRGHERIGHLRGRAVLDLP